MESIPLNTSQCVSLSVSGPMERESKLFTDTACPCPALSALLETHPLWGYKYICPSVSEGSQDKDQATRSNPQDSWARSWCLSSCTPRLSIPLFMKACLSLSCKHAWSFHDPWNLQGDRNMTTILCDILLPSCPA